jgi:hypothetical protein
MKGLTMNYFTDEYKMLCKSDKVQELRPELEEGDNYLNLDYSEGEILLSGIEYHDPIMDDFPRKEHKIIWLPQSHDLDEEIIKTISKHRHYVYTINYWFKQKMHSVIIDGSILREVSDTNPLIAKLKLLIKLLESE